MRMYDVNTIKRFWNLVHKRGTTGCWEWRACRTWGGYGRFRLFDKGRTVSAHRMAWEIANNRRLPIGYACICHTCDNKLCCNPAHLYLGNPITNVEDRVARNRSARGDKINTAKLKEKDVLRIRQLWGTRELTQVAMAKLYNVEKHNINAIIKRKTWTHI